MEELRDRLVKMFEKTGEVTEEILTMSEELDKLIVIDMKKKAGVA